MTNGRVPTIEEVRISKFGCMNCLYAGCECKNYSNFKPDWYEGSSKKLYPTCKGYTYYD